MDSSLVIFKNSEFCDFFCVSDGNGNPFLVAAAPPPQPKKIAVDVATRRGWERFGKGHAKKKITQKLSDLQVYQILILSAGAL